MAKKTKKELSYAAQVVIMSLGTILGIVSVILAVTYVYFRDLIHLLLK